MWDQSSVIAHCGTDRVPQDLVMEIEAPEGTDTWKPLPHRDIINAVQNLINEAGMQVDSRSYSLSKNGGRMFGVWTLHETFEGGDVFKAIGFRNSIDKSMSIGMCAGEKVFVCDNLAFSGQYVSIRKHTGGLDADELAFVGAGAMLTISEQFKHMQLENRILYDTPVKRPLQLVNEVVSGGIVNKLELPDFLSILSDYKDGSTLGNFFGAFTQLIREQNYLKISERAVSARKFLLERAVYE